jgi:hypothetical protein
MESFIPSVRPVALPNVTCFSNRLIYWRHKNQNFCEAAHCLSNSGGRSRCHKASRSMKYGPCTLKDEDCTLGNTQRRSVTSQKTGIRRRNRPNAFKHTSQRKKKFIHDVPSCPVLQATELYYRNSERESAGSSESSQFNLITSKWDGPDWGGLSWDLGRIGWNSGGQTYTCCFGGWACFTLTGRYSGIFLYY